MNKKKQSRPQPYQNKNNFPALASSASSSFHNASSDTTTSTPNLSENSSLNTAFNTTPKKQSQINQQQKQQQHYRHSSATASMSSRKSSSSSLSSSYNEIHRHYRSNPKNKAEGTTDSHGHSHIPVRHPITLTANNQQKLSDYHEQLKRSKNAYVRANFHVAVDPQADYSLNISDPDHLVDWDLIEQVLYLCDVRSMVQDPIQLQSHSNSNQQLAQTRDGQNRCAICLDQFSAPKMSKCGHVFCFVCIIRYLQYSPTLSGKCPLCMEIINFNDLKSCQFRPIIPFHHAAHANLHLMVCSKSSIIPVPCSNDNNKSFDSFHAIADANRNVKTNQHNFDENTQNQSRLPGEVFPFAFQDDGALASVQAVIPSQAHLSHPHYHASHPSSATTSTSSIIIKKNRIACINEPYYESMSRTIPFDPGPNKPLFSMIVLADYKVVLDMLDQELEAVHVIMDENNATDPTGKSHPDITIDVAAKIAVRCIKDRKQEIKQKIRAVTSKHVVPQAQQYYFHHQRQKEPLLHTTVAHTDPVLADIDNPGQLMYESKHQQSPVNYDASNLESSSPSSSNLRYFYQSVEGENLYLHSFNAKCLIYQYQDLANAPSIISAPIINLERKVMDQNLRNRLRYLAHLPIGCEFTLCELDLRNILNKETSDKFSAEIRRRRENERKKHAQEVRQRNRELKKCSGIGQEFHQQIQQAIGVEAAAALQKHYEVQRAQQLELKHMAESFPELYVGGHNNPSKLEKESQPKPQVDSYASVTERMGSFPTLASTSEGTPVRASKGAQIQQDTQFPVLGIKPSPNISNKISASDNPWNKGKLGQSTSSNSSKKENVVLFRSGQMSRRR